MRIGSLCTGTTALDRAVQAVLGGEVVWVADTDEAATALIAARLPGVPNLGDLTTVDWATVPPVDVLTAGYPCPPFSSAGQRKGTDDPRHIWASIARAVRHLRPDLVVLENVAGHVSLGFDAVLADLASLGFDAEWQVVRACDVGACHRRARLFVAAYPCHGTGDRERPRPQPLKGGASADSHYLGRERSGGTWNRRSGSPDRPAAHPEGAERGERPVTDWGRYGHAIARHAAVLGRPAPAPADALGRLNPVFVEWMQMLPEGWVTDPTLGLSRSAQLRLLGNGVVPAQAEAALRSLLDPVP